jgi:predicted  nucleic acid-binding Zn-ribbon protein
MKSICTKCKQAAASEQFGDGCPNCGSTSIPADYMAEEIIGMKALEGKQLVLRMTGTVEESNLVEFEADAMAALATINQKLETDDDFAEAKLNIDRCKLIANRIATERSTALNKIAAISEVISITQRVEKKFDEVRLILTKLVGTETDRRKAEVLAAAKKRLTDRLAGSLVKHGFAIDQTAIANAAKNRRSLKNLEDAVNEVIDAEIFRLAGMELAFHNNMVKIAKSEAEWPGLFPDRQNIALSAPETVDAMIVGRVADHRLKVAEKARREQEEEARAEAARLAESEAERLVLAKLSNTIPQPMPTPPIAEIAIPLPPGNNAKSYMVTFVIVTGYIPGVIQRIKTMHGVKSVKFEEYADEEVA